jgi:transposase
LIRSVIEEGFISSVLVYRHKPSTKKRAYEVYKAAKETVGTNMTIYALSAELRDILQDLIRPIHKTDEIKALIYEKLKDFEPYKRLISIPSVGPIIAATFLAEIGPIECHDHPRQIIKLVLI